MKHRHQVLTVTFAVLFSLGVLHGAFHHHHDNRDHRDCQTCLLKQSVQTSDLPVGAILFDPQSPFHVIRTAGWQPLPQVDRQKPDNRGPPFLNVRSVPHIQQYGGSICINGLFS